MDLIEKLSQPIRRGDNYDTLLYWIDVAHKMSDLGTMMEVDPPLFAIEDFQLDTDTYDPRLDKMVADYKDDPVACEVFREQVLLNFVTDRISYYHTLLHIKPADSIEGRAKQLLSMVTEPLTLTPDGKIMWQFLHNSYELEQAVGVSWDTYKKYEQYDDHVETRGRVRSKTHKISGMAEGILGIRYLYRDPDVKYYTKRKTKD